jgi:hypothetical protein
MVVRLLTSAATNQSAGSSPRFFDLSGNEMGHASSAHEHPKLNECRPCLSPINLQPITINFPRHHYCLGWLVQFTL